VQEARFWLFDQGAFDVYSQQLERLHLASPQS